MAKEYQSELTVITKAKDLCRYVINATAKSPKQFRFTFVSRLQNLALDILENLYRANDTFVTRENLASWGIRLEFQHKSISEAKILAYVSQLAMESKALTMKQFEMISMLTTDVERLTGAWISSDRKRFKPA